MSTQGPDGVENLPVSHPVGVDDRPVNVPLVEPPGRFLGVMVGLVASGEWLVCVHEQIECPPKQVLASRLFLDAFRCR